MPVQTTSIRPLLSTQNTLWFRDYNNDKERISAFKKYPNKACIYEIETSPEQLTSEIKRFVEYEKKLREDNRLLNRKFIISACDGDRYVTLAYELSVDDSSSHPVSTMNYRFLGPHYEEDEAMLSAIFATYVGAHEVEALLAKNMPNNIGSDLKSLKRLAAVATMCCLDRLDKTMTTKELNEALTRTRIASTRSRLLTPLTSSSGGIAIENSDPALWKTVKDFPEVKTEESKKMLKVFEDALNATIGAGHSCDNWKEHAPWTRRTIHSLCMLQDKFIGRLDKLRQDLEDILQDRNEGESPYTAELNKRAHDMREAIEALTDQKCREVLVKDHNIYKLDDEYKSKQYQAILFMVLLGVAALIFLGGQALQSFDPGSKLSIFYNSAQTTILALFTGIVSIVAIVAFKMDGVKVKETIKQANASYASIQPTEIPQQQPPQPGVQPAVVAERGGTPAALEEGRAGFSVNSEEASTPLIDSRNLATRVPDPNDLFSGMGNLNRVPQPSNWRDRSRTDREHGGRDNGESRDRNSRGDSEASRGRRASTGVSM